ncbi:MAG: hypothetical protein PVI01_14930 [Gemmatimonadales bacterium]|jgi:hypothetical protein
MVAVLTLLSVVAVSIIIVRVATKALQLTGLSAEAARFQAYSAFSGTGDTLVLYGKRSGLDELESRLAGASGDAAHEKARHVHERELREQDIDAAKRESLRSEPN